MREIVARWLGEVGFDGLVRWDGECSCTLDDLMRCDMCVEDFDGCSPARLITCQSCGAKFFWKADGDD